MQSSPVTADKNHPQANRQKEMFKTAVFAALPHYIDQ